MTQETMYGTDQRLAGTWQLTHIDDSPPVPSTPESTTRWDDDGVGETTMVLAPGGGLVAISTGSPATALGSWSTGESGAFQAVFVVYDFSTELKFMLKSQGRVSGTFEEDRMEGTFTFDVFDPSGKHLEIEGGRITVKRLRA
jgi:hypothetical protein